METVIVGNRLILASDFAWAEREATGTLVRLHDRGQVFEPGLTLEQLQARLGGTEATQTYPNLPQWKPNPGHEPDDIKRVDGEYKEAIVLFAHGGCRNIDRRWDWKFHIGSMTITHYMVIEGA